MSTKVENPTKKTKLLVDGYIALQNGEFLCHCIELSDNSDCDHIVSIDDVMAHLGSGVEVDMGYGDSITVKPSVYFNDLSILDTQSLFAEIINKREERTEIADMPDLHPLFQQILAPFTKPTNAA